MCEGLPWTPIRRRLPRVRCLRRGSAAPNKKLSSSGQVPSVGLGDEQHLTRCRSTSWATRANSPALARSECAVVFGAIALCAFLFDAAAVRLWFQHHRIGATLITPSTTVSAPL